METTDVIFRKWNDGAGIIALFINDPGTMDPSTCNSYMHLGQHGSARPDMIIDDSKPTSPEEYADLQSELESIGYKLRILKRTPRNAYANRSAQINHHRKVDNIQQ